MKPRLCIVHNAIPEYRQPFFALLAQSVELELFIDARQPDIGTVAQGYGIAPESGKGVNGLQSALRRFRPDIVVTGNWDTGTQLLHFYRTARFCKKRDIPYLVWSEEWGWPMTWRRKLAQPLIAMLVHDAGAVIVPGTRGEKHFLRMGVRANRLFRAPNASVAPMATKGRTSSLPLIATVARFLPRKGLRELCQAFASMHNAAELVLYGADDPAAPAFRQEIEQLCYTLNIASRVQIVRDNGDVTTKVQIYADCDIFVLASTAKPIAEPWGLVLNEVLPFGKPIVTTDAVGAVPDLVREDENGSIARAGQPLSLARALDTLVADAGLRLEYGRRSQELSREFTYAHMTQGFLSAIHSVLSALQARRSSLR